MEPIAPNPSQLSVKQKKLKKKFDSAESVNEMLTAFENLEKSFDEKDLGFICSKVALKLDIEHPEKVLSFSSRALAIMTENKSGFSSSVLSLPIAENLKLLGSACCKLKMFDESLGYLTRAAKSLRKLERDSSSTVDNLVLGTLISGVQFLLFAVKNKMGNNDDSIVHLKRYLRMTEKIWGKGSRELAKANREVYEMYIKEGSFEKALPFCTKAMTIFKKAFGENSMEVLECRTRLGIIYYVLGENKKGLEMNKLSQRSLVHTGCSSMLLRAEIDTANTLRALGKHEEAVKLLNGAVSKTEKLSQDRILSLTCMAEILCDMENYEEAKECAKKVRGIFDKKLKGITPVQVALGLSRIANVYEILEEFETAISCLIRVPPIVKKLPPEVSSCAYFLDIPPRIGQLFVSVGKIEQAIPYLEEAVEAKKRGFGPKHFEVGYAYGTLGAAYYHSKQFQLAADVCAYAKDILDESLGRLHNDSIFACKNLCQAYMDMGRFLPAISHLEEIMKRHEALGPSARDLVKEDVKSLAILKARVRGDMSEVLRLTSDPDAVPDEDYLEADKYTPSIFAKKNAFGGVRGRGQPGANDELNVKGLKIEEPVSSKKSSTTTSPMEKNA